MRRSSGRAPSKAAIFGWNYCVVAHIPNLPVRHRWYRSRKTARCPRQVEQRQTNVLGPGNRRTDGRGGWYFSASINYKGKKTSGSGCSFRLHGTGLPQPTENQIDRPKCEENASQRQRRRPRSTRLCFDSKAHPHRNWTACRPGRATARALSPEAGKTGPDREGYRR